MREKEKEKTKPLRIQRQTPLYSQPDNELSKPWKQGWLLERGKLRHLQKNAHNAILYILLLLIFQYYIIINLLILYIINYIIFYIINIPILYIMHTIHIHVPVCTHICFCVYVCVCAYVCVHLYVHVYVCVCMRTHAHVVTKIWEAYLEGQWLLLTDGMASIITKLYFEFVYQTHALLALKNILKKKWHTIFRYVNVFLVTCVDYNTEKASAFEKLCIY